jgi:hypothetical protein
MMKKISVLILMLGFHLVFSQQIPSADKTSEIEKIDSSTVKSGELPIYPGGIDVFKRNFSQMFNASKINAKGTVKSEAQLIISEGGNVTDIKIVGNNKSKNKEMERVAKIMSKTQWIPAKINGKPVKFKFKLPITMVFE